MAKQAKTEATADDTFEGGDGSVMIDLSGVKEASFEVIPRGTYNGVISSCDYQLSANSGQPMWAVQIILTDGEFEGRKLFTHLSFAPKALPMTKKNLTFIAPELASTAFNPETEASNLEGRAVRFKTVIRKYEGEDRTNVRDFLPPSSDEAFM